MNVIFKRIVSLVTLSSFFMWNLAIAAPEGGSVAAGSAAISQSGNTTTINQTSQNVVINWNGFNTSSNEAVQFNQPNSSAIALNRINSGLPTTFAGQLSANGQVWILNPAGVLFTSSSTVDVAGLVATTHAISDANFMAGNFRFDAVPGFENSKIINDGLISAKDMGMVALVAPGVENNGVIVANMGKVHLASGTAFVLDMYGDGLINFGNSAPAQSGYVKNAGKIVANGGKVYMTANSAAHAVDNVINMSGVIEARSVSSSKGTIILHGGKHGKVKVSGKLDTSNVDPNEVGGFIETSGAVLLIEPAAEIDPGKGGTWLIDPWEIIVDEILAGMISADLSSGINVSLYADAYLYVLSEILQAPGSDFGVLSLSSGYYLEVSAPITLNNGALSLWADGYISIYSPLSLTNGEHSIQTSWGDIGIYSSIDVFNSYMSIYAGGNVYINSPIMGLGSYLSVGTGESEEGGGSIYIDAPVMMNGGGLSFYADYSIYIDSPVSITDGDGEFYAWNEIYINAGITQSGEGSLEFGTNSYDTIYIDSAAPIVSDGSQYYYSDVMLAGDTTLTSNFGNIYFYSTVDSDWCLEVPASLTINVLEGFVKFRDDVGDYNPLNNLIINGMTKFWNWCDEMIVVTWLSQIYNGAVIANTDMELVTINNGAILLDQGYSAPYRDLILVPGADGNADAFVHGDNIDVGFLLFSGYGKVDLFNTTVDGFSGPDAFDQVLIFGSSDHYCVNGVGIGTCVVAPSISLENIVQSQFFTTPTNPGMSNNWAIKITDADGNEIGSCDAGGCVMDITKNPL